MNSADIIGYTADADTWCPECAVTEYGGANRNIILMNGVPEFIETPLDHEGNPVAPMFCGTETDSPICCCRCMEPIETTVLDPEARHTQQREDTGEMPEIRKRATALGVMDWVATLEMWEDGLTSNIEYIAPYGYWTDLRHLSNLASPQRQGFLEGNERGETDMARYAALMDLSGMVQDWIEDHFPCHDEDEEPDTAPVAYVAVLLREDVARRIGLDEATAGYDIDAYCDECSNSTDKVYIDDDGDALCANCRDWRKAGRPVKPDQRQTESQITNP